MDRVAPFFMRFKDNLEFHQTPPIGQSDDSGSIMTKKRAEYSKAALQPIGIRNTWPICRRLTFFTPFRRFRMDTFVP